jgi:hypothetical protein
MVQTRRGRHIGSSSSLLRRKELAVTTWPGRLHHSTPLHHGVHDQIAPHADGGRSVCGSQVYAHVLPDMQVEAAATLGALLHPVARKFVSRASAKPTSMGVYLTNRGMVRKRGFEPPRGCPRQPLKLVKVLCGRELTRILPTKVGRKRAQAHASDDFIRTHSHTACPDGYPWVARPAQAGHLASRTPLRRQYEMMTHATRPATQV